jgi:hypothetical protein
MQKITLSCLAFLFCLQTMHGQNGLIKIDLPAGATIQSLDSPKKQPDSTELVNGLIKSFCDKLGEHFKAGNVTLPYLSQTAISSFLTEKNQDALKILSDTQSAMSFAYIEKGFSIALRASIDNCPLVDTFLNFDGRQRPAFAHLNQAVCRCITDKKSGFKDPELAQVKYSYIRDSCWVEVFRDPEQIKIAYAANDFQTKAEIDAFDRNFQGYFFKNCSECFDALMYGYKVTFAAIEKRQAAAKPFAYRSENASNVQQNASMMHILHLITPTLGIYSERKTAELFASSATYRSAVATINSTKLRLKNNLVVDYMPNTTDRSDGIMEYRFTMYQYAAKTKKRTIVCQLIFEFEGNSELIGAFRYIDRSQIANLQTLQNQLDGQ